MYDEDDEYMTDDEREASIGYMFPDGDDPDFNDDDDGIGSFLG